MDLNILMAISAYKILCVSVNLFACCVALTKETINRNEAHNFNQKFSCLILIY